MYIPFYLCITKYFTFKKSLQIPPPFLDLINFGTVMIRSITTVLMFITAFSTTALTFTMTLTFTMITTTRTFTMFFMTTLPNTRRLRTTTIITNICGPRNRRSERRLKNGSRWEPQNWTGWKRGWQRDAKYMFYLMTHSTHFIYGYIASDIP